METGLVGSLGMIKRLSLQKVTIWEPYVEIEFTIFMGSHTEVILATLAIQVTQVILAILVLLVTVRCPPIPVT